MPRTIISNIKADTCVHEATTMIARQCMDWDELLRLLYNRMRALQKADKLPEWANTETIYCMMLVAILQRFSVQLLIAKEEHEPCYSEAKRLLDSFGLSEDLCALMADFLLANAGIRRAMTTALKDDLGALPWQSN